MDENTDRRIFKKGGFYEMAGNKGSTAKRFYSYN